MSSLSILVDGGLLSSSMAACFYCVLLSRRVRRLASADQGVGKGIADMVQAVERLNASLERTRMAAKTESDTLQRQLVEAKSLSERTGDLLQEGDHQIGDLARGLADARQVVEVLEDLVDTADKRRTRARKPSQRTQAPAPLATVEPEEDTPEPAAIAGRAGGRKTRARAKPAVETSDPISDGDITMLLLDAITLDLNDDTDNDTDDPLPDVRPRASKRVRTEPRAAARGV